MTKASVGGNQHEIVRTPMIKAFEDACSLAKTGGGPPLTTGLGDATLVWFERNVPALHKPGTTTLIMTDDANLGIRV